MEDKTSIEEIKKSLEEGSYSGIKKIDLIIQTKDIAFIKECIYNEKISIGSSEKAYIIKVIGSSEYTKQCIYDKRLNLDSSAKINLIKSIGDSEYIKQCIDDEELAFSLSDKIKLIQATGDIELVKKYLDSGINISLLEKAYLIKSTNNAEYINQCIQSGELDKELRAALITVINEERIHEQEKIKYNLRDSELVKLPPEMTFGIEIESEGYNKAIIERNIFVGKWRVDKEASLEEGKGIELVSPVLRAGKEDTQEIYSMCNILSDLGQKVSERCGAHVHIGANYLTSKAAYINLLTIWGNTESIIYKISNPPGEITRVEALIKKDNEQAYAPLISKKIEQAVEEGNINMEEDGELSSFIEQLQNVQNEKYSGINFSNVGKQGKNTIEFRVPNGTLDPKVWVENINLFGGIIKAAEEISQIDEEKIKLASFYKICSRNSNEKELLDSLLLLTVSEEQKPIYEKRYRENNALYNSNPELEDIVKNNISIKPIMPKDIGKRVFVQDNITGMEMQDASRRLNSDITRENTNEQIQPDE